MKPQPQDSAHVREHCSNKNEVPQTRRSDDQLPNSIRKLNGCIDGPVATSVVATCVRAGQPNVLKSHGHTCVNCHGCQVLVRYSWNYRSTICCSEALGEGLGARQLHLSEAHFLTKSELPAKCFCFEWLPTATLRFIATYI